MTGQAGPGTAQPGRLGLDVGTSSVKAVLVADDGTVLGRGSSAYGTVRDGPGRAEQDPADYRRAAADAVAQCRSGGHPVTAVGLVGQTPTLVLVDAAGTPVRPALTWQDQRATAEAAELADALGDPYGVVGTSLPWSPSALPAKLLWLARHEPDAVGAARWALQPKDLLGLALTGVAGSDPWSSKGLCHVLSHQPCQPVLDLAGVPAALVPPIRPAWEPLGTALDGNELSLPAGIPVTVGWSDALAGMLAVGAFGAPTAFALTGTSDIVGTTVRSGPDSAPPLYAVPETCAPMTIVYGPTSTSGASLVWLAGVTGSTVPELVELAAGLTGSDDVPVFLPYLDGERAPIWRPDVAGAFVGLRHGHTRAHLARAVLAGVACSELHVLRTAEELTGAGPSGAVLTAGVGSAHRAWQQVRAATFGCPVSAYDEPNLTAVGAAMLAAAAGTGEPLSGLSRLRGRTVTVEPEPDDVRAAATRYARYREESEHACATA